MMIKIIGFPFVHLKNLILWYTYRVRTTLNPPGVSLIKTTTSLTSLYTPTYAFDQNKKTLNSQHCVCVCVVYLALRNTHYTFHMVLFWGVSR